MSEERLTTIRERSDRASEGPWQAYQEPTLTNSWKIDARWRLFCGFDRGADAEFVANARADIPWLLAEVERLTAALRDIRLRIPPSSDRAGGRRMSDEGRCETCEHWCLPVRHRGRWCEVLKLVTGSAESCEYYEAVVARDVTIEGKEER